MNTCKIASSMQNCICASKFIRQLKTTRRFKFAAPFNNNILIYNNILIDNNILIGNNILVDLEQALTCL
jgi:hypothetical protein